jgi:hypothetical protein
LTEERKKGRDRVTDEETEESSREFIQQRGRNGAEEQNTKIKDIYSKKERRRRKKYERKGRENLAERDGDCFSYENFVFLADSQN